MMSKRHTVIKLILILAALAVIFLLIISVSIWRYGNKDETRAADVAIVLGAAASEASPSPVYRERLNHGIRLYQQGYVSKLILTGGLAATIQDFTIGWPGLLLQVAGAYLVCKYL